MFPLEKMLIALTRFKGATLNILKTIKPKVMTSLIKIISFTGEIRYLLG